MSGAATVQASRGQNARALVSTFKAPLLDRIINTPETEQRHVVLDLGWPSQALLNRLSASRPCRIEIADLVGTGALKALRAPEFLDAENPSDVRDFLPNIKHPLDLILCWDLPNYLSLPVLMQLCAVLAEKGAPGCRLHMLVAYSQREMPAVPARYALNEDGQMVQTCASGEVAQAPRYSPEALGVAAGEFHYERGVLLANGMQEFVYALPR